MKQIQEDRIISEFFMRWILVFLSIVQASLLCAKPVSIHVQERGDYEVLDLFFKMGLLEEEYAYVLKGIKPISARQFYPLDAFPMKDLQYSENEFKKTVLVREATEVWNRLCSRQDRFALKTIPIVEKEPDACGFEVQFIHVPKLREVIGQNLNLFRYVLGPNVEVDELVNRLAYSGERFTDVLQDDLTLTGIVLGFGSHNSIVGGRLETIDRLSISRDSAPYLPKSALLQGENSWWMYGTYYLEYAGGKDSSIRQTTTPAHPSFGFSTLHDEMHLLESKKEPLPESLHNQPRFIFNAFRGGDSNEDLFRSLQKTQLEGRSLLQTDRRLDKILEIIGGCRPQITCDKSPVQKTVWALVNNVEATWVPTLEGVACRFTDATDRKKFNQALTTPPLSPTPPPMMSASREMLKGMNLARENLVAAANRCLELSKDPSMQTVIPNQLYMKTLQAGEGESLGGLGRLRLKYVIEDDEGNILFAHNDTWIHLSEAIPGFIHGLQGMRIGEKRTLYIHPALGYGALTTLPPCALLVAHVQLLDADPGSKVPLPPITPLELDWLLNPQPVQTLQESIALLPIYAGAFYRGLLNQAASEYPSMDLLKLLSPFAEISN